MPSSDMPTERFLMMYCFPVQLVVGVVGNLLNLMVLLSKRMRSKTNIILAGVALADILFLLFMVPHSLMYHKLFTKNPAFKSFIVYANYHIIGIVNACSFASAWLIVIVSFERAMAIACPLRSRDFWTGRMLAYVICGVWVCAVITSFPAHITHTLERVPRNETVLNETTGIEEVVTKEGLRPTVRPNFEQLWRISTFTDTILIVFVPVILVVLANAMMILTLRQQNQFVKHIQTQKRATFIVLVIASTFTFCHTPSAIIHIVEIVWPEIGMQREFWTAATLTNTLVITEKTVNFFMFCMWSAHFRKNLYRILSGYILSRWRRKESKPNIPLLSHSYP